MKVVKNLCVKLQTYTGKDGLEKSKWLNIGSIMEKDDGGKFIFLDRHINLAAIPFKPNSTAILVSMFDPKEDDDVAKNNKQAQAKVEDSEDIPF